MRERASGRVDTTAAGTRRGPAAAGACLVAITLAVFTLVPALALSAVVITTLAAALFAAAIAHPVGAAPSHLRTAVVLGAVAYLVGLPVAWLTTRNVEAIAGDMSESWTYLALATLLGVFAFTFAWASRRR